MLNVNIAMFVFPEIRGASQAQVSFLEELEDFVVDERVVQVLSCLEILGRV